MEFITVRQLVEKLNISIFVITNLLDRHEYEKPKGYPGKPIWKNEANKKILLKDLLLYSKKPHYNVRFQQKIKKAIAVLKKEKWCD